MICRFCFFGSLPILLLVAGCVSQPSAALPNVQREVGSRSGLAVAWPQNDVEKSEANAAVAALLKKDLTADSAAAIALLNSPKLRATFEDLGLSQADVIAAGRLPNPSFSASVRWPDKRPRPPNVEFNLGFDLLNALLLPLRQKFSGEQLVAAERRVAHEALALATDAKIAVYTVIARQEFRARLQSIVDVNETAADFAQRQYDAGNINRLDLLNQQVAGQQARLELARIDAELKRDREKLNRLLGLSGAQTEWQIAAALPSADESDPGLDQVETLAVAQRLDLAAAQSEVALARAALDLKRKTRLFPASVNVGLDTEREPGGTSGHTHVTGPNVELALPIFDQGQAEIARLSAQARRAEDNYEALAIDVRSEAREARDALVAARGAAEYYETVLVPQRRTIQRETLLQYNAMQKNNYELLAAKQQVVEAERGRVEAWRDYWIARAELERAVGGRLPPVNAASAQTAAHP